MTSQFLDPTEPQDGAPASGGGTAYSAQARADCVLKDIGRSSTPGSSICEQRDAEDRRNHDAPIIANLMQAAQLLHELLAARLTACNVSEARLTALRTISDAEPDGCSQAELAGQLRQTESSVSTLVDRMRNNGLLYRLRSKTDRRKRVLMLTEAGRTLLREAQRVYDRAVGGLFAGFDGDERRLLGRLLREFVEQLLLAENDAAQGSHSAASGGESPKHNDTQSTAA